MPLGQLSSTLGAIVRPLFASRKFIPNGEHVVRYRGSAGGLDEELLLEVLRDLVVAKPILGWLPSGGVLRDQLKACAWAKWYSSFQQKRFRDEPIENCRLTLLLVTDPARSNLNLVFRLEPIIGEGSISYSSLVRRTSEDEYACFEY